MALPDQAFCSDLTHYWLLTAVATVIIVVAPQLSQHGREADAPWILASFLFIPWTSSAGIPLPVVGLGWTLNYEMYFYLIFAIALLLPRRSAVIAMTVFFLLSISLGYVMDRNGAFIAQATHWLLAEFLLGVFLGLLFKGGRSIPNALGVILILASCVLLMLALAFRTNGTLVPILRFAFFGLAAACIVTTMTLTPLSQKLLFPKSVLLLGNVSYSLYLTHVFTLPAMLLVLRRLSPDFPAWATITLLFVASILIAVIFYVVFEKPTQKILRSRRMPQTGRKAA